jgi:hypothetical protein
MNTVPAAIRAAAAIAIAFAIAGAPLAAQAAPVPPAAPAAPASPAEQPAEGKAAVDAVTAAFAAAQYAASVLEPIDAYKGASAACSKALDAALDQAIAGKWKSAYDGLLAFDAKGADPYALAMEIDLVLGGALRSDQHLSFALKDLATGETIEDLRQTEGDYPMFAFDPSALAEAQAKAGVAAPAILSKHLGNYFYDVRSYFAGGWKLPDDQIAAKCLESYGKAYAAGSFTLETLGRQVELLTQEGKSAEAEPLLRKSVELSPKDPQLKFNLAQLILGQNRNEEGMKALDEAIAAYGEGPDRLQAIAVAARKAAELGDRPAYERYMGNIDAAMPDNPTPNLLRHMIAVERGWDAEANKLADALALSNGSAPQVVRTILSSWFGAGKAAEARAFLDRNIASSKDEAAKATLNFYLAVLVAQDEVISDADRSAGVAALDAAEAYFKKNAKPEDDVLQAISQVRGVLVPPPAPASPAAPAAPAQAAPGAPAAPIKP